MTFGKKQIVRCAQVTVFAVSLSCLGWLAYSVIFYVKTSPRFEVEKLSVSGLRRVDESQVLAQAGFNIGTNVFDVNLGEMRERVEQIPWVRHALVERVLVDEEGLARRQLRDVGAQRGGVHRHEDVG